MKAKRILALLLAMMMVFMLAACSSDKKEDTSASSSTDSSTSAEKKEEPKKEEKKEEPKKEEKKEEPKKEETAPAAEENENITIECLFSNHDSQPYTEATWLLPKKALEKFNITMNMNAIPSASFEEKKNTTLASGEIPDLVMGVAKSVCDEYGKLGMFMNFMNYIDIMPNMAKIMDEYPTLKAYMPSENEMYAQASQITTAGAVNTACYFIPMIRMDIMNELGLSQWESYDEFYDVLAAMKTKYPDSYPWVNRQGIAFIISVFAPGLGIDSFPSGLSSTGWGVWKEDSKSFTSIMDEPNFKEWVIFMNKLYNDGLLDPSYATDDTQTWESKIVSGAGFFACDYFARPEM
ncbi:MAG: extracellular solute-binding protein, partial [Clostridiales bacterium]|nr:extracellular solute-binding protein [Clostridiales bacterium]